MSIENRNYARAMKVASCMLTLVLIAAAETLYVKVSAYPINESIELRSGVDLTKEVEKLENDGKFTECLDLCNEARKQGNLDALRWLAEKYKKGWFDQNGKTNIIKKDINTAISIYEEAVNNGDIKLSCYELGKLYEEKGIPDKAKANYLRSAELGNAKAQLALGNIYRKDTKSKNDAIKWYVCVENNVDAEDEDRRDAYIALGEMYENNKRESVQDKGESVQNYLKAKEYYEKAHGNKTDDQIANVLYKLALISIKIGEELDDKEGASKYYKEGFSYFDRAANAGYADAKRELAIYYLTGCEPKVTTMNISKGQNYLVEAAKSSECPQAKYDLGYFYETGEYEFKQDYKKAIELYYGAALLGYVPAQCRLAHCYRLGLGTDKNRKDNNSAKIYYKMAANAQNLETEIEKKAQQEAQYQLGNYYAEEAEKLRESLNAHINAAKEELDTVEKSDLAKATEQMGAIEHLRNEKELEQSKIAEYLALIMSETVREEIIKDKNINGITTAETNAVDWYTKSAKQGYANAQNKLGDCYAKGLGVEENAVEAREWYEKAANQGHKQAQNSLGDCYYYGHGVDMDKKKAVEWYAKAAEPKIMMVEERGTTSEVVVEKGLPEAQYNLGYCYYYGDGVKTDEKTGIEWIKRSADQGYEVARAHLRDCGID